MSGILDFIGGLIKPVTNLVDDLTTSDEERALAKAKLLEIENQLTSKYLELESQVVQAKQNVMVAELNQTDNYTKRARPTVIYGGLLILLINHVLLPWIAYFKEGVEKLPTIDLPTEFWLAWGGIVSVYAFGRTREKLNASKQ